MKTYKAQTLAKMIKDGRVELTSDIRPIGIEGEAYAEVRWTGTKRPWERIRVTGDLSSFLKPSMPPTAQAAIQAVNEMFKNPSGYGQILVNDIIVSLVETVFDQVQVGENDPDLEEIDAAVRAAIIRYLTPKTK